MASATASLFRIYAPDECGEDGYPRNWHRLHVSGHLLHYGVKDLVREEAGNRCVRCAHPYTSGEHPLELDPKTAKRVSWSPCDVRCTHGGPIRYRFAEEATWIDFGHIADNGWVDVPGYAPTRDRLRNGGLVQAAWRILTVHHLNGVKEDLRWWNLASLCQRCHLTIQGKVYLARPWTREHSEWFKPYAAGWYAYHYLGEELSREETEARLDELLDIERWPTLFDEAIQ